MRNKLQIIAVEQKRVCFRCGSDKTSINKTRKGTPYARWNHDKEGHLICNKCYNKQWYLDNPNYNKQWRLDNPNYDKQYSKIWNALNTEYNKQRHMIYYALNSERYRQSVMIWRELNPNYHKLWYRRNRLRMLEYKRRYYASRRGI